MKRLFNSMDTGGDIKMKYFNSLICSLLTKRHAIQPMTQGHDFNGCRLILQVERVWTCGNCSNIHVILNPNEPTVKT